MSTKKDMLERIADALDGGGDFGQGTVNEVGYLERIANAFDGGGNFGQATKNEISYLERIAKYLEEHEDSGGDSGGGGDDPNIVRLRKYIIAPEQTVTISNDYYSTASLETESGAPTLQDRDIVSLIVNGITYICVWTYSQGIYQTETIMEENGDKCGVFANEELRFTKYNYYSGTAIPGDYTVEFSKLVPVTD